MLWVLKITVSIRQLFWAPKTYVTTNGYENISNFTLIFFYPNVYCLLSAFTENLGNVPFASIIATLVVFVGVGLFCGALFRALTIVLKLIMEDLFHFNVAWWVSISLTPGMLGIFHAFVVICWLLKKKIRKIFQVTLIYQSVKWLGSRPRPTFCWSCSGSKLIARVVTNFSVDDKIEC